MVTTLSRSEGGGSTAAWCCSIWVPPCPRREEVIAFDYRAALKILLGCITSLPLYLLSVNIRTAMQRDSKRKQLVAPHLFQFLIVLVELYNLVSLC